ncbi:hypothetical protein CRD59_06115 [Bifidobacterium xylocopae]|uniref:HTH cro/C1-type domain-containing protein n=1 Tax=Bifidobacterium xylocopae TaxID=2493119 RepID=A0A366KBE2_9BIFI|nr:hypothetical protein CRD59_06115 [Bifidobacterium xylocopae]
MSDIGWWLFTLLFTQVVLGTFELVVKLRFPFPDDPTEQTEQTEQNGESSTPQPSSLASQIKHLRMKAGLSQDQHACRLGVTRAVVRAWEQGGRRPDAGNLQALLDVSACPMAQNRTRVRPTDGVYGQAGPPPRALPSWISSTIAAAACIGRTARAQCTCLTMRICLVMGAWLFLLPCWGAKRTQCSDPRFPWIVVGSAVSGVQGLECTVAAAGAYRGYVGLDLLLELFQAMPVRWGERGVLEQVDQVVLPPFHEGLDMKVAVPYLVVVLEAVAPGTHAHVLGVVVVGHALEDSRGRSGRTPADSPTGISSTRVCGLLEDQRGTREGNMR